MALAGQIIRAGDFPATVAQWDGTDILGFTNTSYQAGSPVCGVAFTAPTSGKVVLLWHARMQSLTIGVRVVVSVAVRTGGVVGSGTSVVASGDDAAVETTADAAAGNNQHIGAGTSLRVFGLTPGSTYNVQVEHRMLSAGSGNIYGRAVTVIPAP